MQDQVDRFLLELKADLAATGQAKSLHALEIRQEATRPLLQAYFLDLSDQSELFDTIHDLFLVISLQLAPRCDVDHLADLHQEVQMHSHEAQSNEAYAASYRSLLVMPKVAIPAEEVLKMRCSLAEIQRGFADILDPLPPHVLSPSSYPAQIDGDASEFHTQSGQVAHVSKVHPTRSAREPIHSLSWA